MQLTYRGTEYSSSNELPATPQTLTGRYRGAEMTMHYGSDLPAQPFHNLTYRGAQYRPESAPTFASEPAIAL